MQSSLEKAKQVCAKVIEEHGNQVTLNQILKIIARETGNLDIGVNKRFLQGMVRVDLVEPLKNGSFGVKEA